MGAPNRGAHFFGCTSARSVVVCAAQVRSAMDRSQLLRGTLDAAVLAVTSSEDAYGYDVLRRLRTAGLAEVGDASVYGTLRRLYAAGALTSYMVPSDEGPARRYYGITDLGRSQLTEAKATWKEFTQVLDALLAIDVEVTT
jgi:PadR family transcriptional regulator, regulatory protein PadR